MGLEFNHAFIQAKEHRSNPAISEAGGIPVIDLSPLFEGAEEAFSRLVAEVGIACKDWGFFQVINHGVSGELLERIQAVAREFFALPVDEKRRVSRGEEKPLGYYDAENTKNVRDWKEVFDFVGNEPVEVPATENPGEERTDVFWNQWAEYPPEFRDTCKEYARGVEKLGHQLLELISLSLGLPAKRLSSFFKEDMSFIRLNHYPPWPEPELALGVGHHKDAGALTVLIQDEVGGLDVRRKSDGEWVRVKPITNSFIINVGDIVQECFHAKRNESVWYLDNGCSKHKTGIKEKFSSLEMKDAGKVTLGDNSQKKIIGIRFIGRIIKLSKEGLWKGVQSEPHLEAAFRESCFLTRKKDSDSIRRIESGVARDKPQGSSRKVSFFLVSRKCFFASVLHKVSCKGV